ncbi:MAG: ZIP family metal transporter [Rhodothermales bacterium]
MPPYLDRMELQELLITTFVAAVLADVSMVFGVAPFFVIKNLSDKVTGTMAAAAAGMMAAASLVQLVGEGLDRTPGLEAWEVTAGLAAGSLMYAAASRWIRDNPKFDLMNLRRTGGAQSLMIVAAMTVHSAPEGVAIGVAFGSQELGLGYSVVSALAVHNIPEAIAITLALRANGVSVWACMGWALFTSLPQPVFAPLAAWFIWLFEPLLPAGMGFAAGAMVYLVVADLLPDALKQTSKGRVAAAFMGGVILMILLGRAVGL